MEATVTAAVAKIVAQLGPTHREAVYQRALAVYTLSP